jgi:hypothetical protein
LRDVQKPSGFSAPRDTMPHMKRSTSR